MKKAERARILVIDDDESIRKSLSTVLVEKGYEVDAAASGDEAIKKCKASFYNLALVDLRLPDMDGIGLLTKIREVVPRMVKIIITGYPSLESAIQAVNCGADGYLVKPHNIDDLLRRVAEKLLEQRETESYSEEKVKEYIETRTREMGYD